MLYLYKNYQEFNNKPVRCIKIGYTSNLKIRNNNYRTANGAKGFSQLGTKEGSKLLESMFHVRFRERLLINDDTGRRSEWCKWDQEVIDSFFVETEESLGKFLWDHRETYLIPFLTPRGKVEKVYKYLEDKYLIEVIELYLDKGILPRYHECRKYLESTKNSFFKFPEVILQSLSTGQLMSLMHLRVK